MDFTEVTGFVECVADYVEQIVDDGMVVALKRFWSNEALYKDKYRG